MPVVEPKRSIYDRSMDQRTEKLWAKQNQHEGDRQRLFSAVAGEVDAAKVLYPGSYVDVAASFAFPEVTYVDTDDRANRFFADVDGVAEIIAEAAGWTDGRRFTFLHRDYRDDLGLPLDSFDLLISLYAGFISEHCTRYLKVGGKLLVNPSHGDAAMASIDDRYRLSAVVTSEDGRYRVSRSGLDGYLIPKREQQITREFLHELGKGIGYTKAPFAYLFERVG